MCKFKNGRKCIFLIFVDLFLYFCKAKKNCDYLVNFQNFWTICFLHGVSLCGFHICFWYHSNPTWNEWDLAKICSAGVFATPPKKKNSQNLNFLRTDPMWHSIAQYIYCRITKYYPNKDVCKNIDLNILKFGQKVAIFAKILATLVTKLLNFVMFHEDFTHLK